MKKKILTKAMTFGISTSLIFAIGLSGIGFSGISVKAENVHNNTSVSATKKESSVVKDEQGLCYRSVRDDEGEVSAEDEWEVYAENLKTDTVVVPDTFEGKKVTAIARGGFRSCKKLVSVTVGANVEHIQSYAFFGCKNLKQVLFQGNSLTSISTAAFEGCQSLKSIEIPKEVASIGDSAFENCTKLQKIKIPNKVTNLWGGTFENCTKLQKVQLSSHLTSVGLWEFSGCSSLKKIVLPSSLTSIGKETFKGCKKLSNVVFQGKTYDIQDGAFAGTPFEKRNTHADGTYIVNKVLLESGNYKGDLTLDGTKKFRGYKIRAIAGNAFSNNTKLGKVTIKNMDIIGGNAFAKCKTKSFRLQNIDTISTWCFYDSETSVMRMTKIKKIKNFSMKKCKEFYGNHIGSATSLSMPNNIVKITIKDLQEETSMPDLGLTDCNKLKEVYLSGNFTTVYEDSIRECKAWESLTIKSTHALEWHWIAGGGTDNRWFAQCENLKDVTLDCPGVDESIRNVFPEWTSLHVPAEQVGEYQKYVQGEVKAI